MSDLKWGYPELQTGGKVKICQQVKTTEDWLNKSAEWARSEWSCSLDDYRVYRAIIQRFHDQHKAAEKAKAEKPKFKAWDYVVYESQGYWQIRLLLSDWNQGAGGKTEGLCKSGDIATSFSKNSYEHYYRPATDPEIESFRKELAENLGLRYDTRVEYKGKEYRIADHDLKAGKPDGEILLKGAGFNVKIQDWPSLKVVEPKEQVKAACVDIEGYIEKEKAKKEWPNLKQAGPIDGAQGKPADKQVLVACYEVRKKIEACGGDWEKYRWGRGCAFCALYKKYPNADLPGCKKRCPLGKYPNVHDPCGALNPHLMEKPSLTPLTEAVDKAIAELKGKVKGKVKLEIGQPAIHRKHGKGIIVPCRTPDKNFPCVFDFEFAGGRKIHIGYRGAGIGSRLSDLTPCDPPPSACPGYEPPAKPSDTPDDWFQPELKNKKARDGVEHIEKALKDVGLEEGITRHQIEFLAEKIEQLERLGK